jgi:hypothetical protein
MNYTAPCYEYIADPGSREVSFAMTAKYVTDHLKFLELLSYVRARGSVVGSGSMLQAGRSRVRFPMTSLDFSINLMLQAAL